MLKEMTEIAADQVHSTLGQHMLTSGYDFVLDLEESQGAWLTDARNGDEYLDFFTFFASNPLGMNHEKLVQDEQFLESLTLSALHKPSNTDIYTQQMADFVSTFSKIAMPDYLPHVFFIDGGALAVENALKVAFDWKIQKNFQKGYRSERGHRVLHLDQAFHGRTGYTLSLTNSAPVKTRYFPKFDWPRIHNPSIRHPLDEQSQSDVEKQEKLALAQAEQYFKEYEDDIACILLEPIQGEGGDNHFRPEFHQALRELADRHEALLIYDEVQTGVGLTGKFWCHEHFVKPDLLAFGKKTQVCGILGSERIDEVEENCFRVPSRINSTWGGNLVDMVRFRRILEVIEEEQLVDHAASAGDYLQEKLEQLSEEYKPISNPRGRGLFCAIDMPDETYRDAMLSECEKNRLLILGCGERSIRFRPPLTISLQQIDHCIEIIEKSCQQLMQDPESRDRASSGRQSAHQL